MQTTLAILGAVRHRFAGCCLIIALLLALSLLLCGVLGWAVGTRVGAQGGIEVEMVLAIDQSPSMWNRGGLGSDPELLRVAAANLFVSYLGADEPGQQHRVGVIHFGGASEVIVPLAELDEALRVHIRQAIANPAPMPWTDPALALRLASGQLLEGSAAEGRRRAILLMTDGEPAWEGAREADLQAYRAALRQQVAELGADGISLFVVLLTSDSTDVSAAINEVWAPFWVEMAALTPRGGFYRARQATELLDIYHQVVVGLTGRQEGTQVLDAAARGPSRYSFEIPANLTRFTLLVWKSQPGLSVDVLLPNGQPVRQSDLTFRLIGEPGISHEAVWAVHDPPAGAWTLATEGEGWVMAWLDVEEAPLPTETATPTASPTPTATPSATATTTPTATATATASPTGTAAPSQTPTATPSPSPTPTGTAIYAPVVMASPAAALDTAASGDAPGGPDRKWLWLAVATGVLMGVVLWRRRQGQRGPILEGSLQNLASPAGSALPLRVELGQALRDVFTFSGDGRGRDLPLPGWDGEGHLMAVEVEGEPAVRLQVLAGEVMVNDQVARTRTLVDGDRLRIGDYVFRFDHVGSARRARRNHRTRPTVFVDGAASATGQRPSRAGG